MKHLILKSKKNIFEEISNIKHSLLNQNNATVAEPFLFGSNDLNDKENTMIIESTVKYITTKIQGSIVMNPFKQVNAFLENFN